MRPCRAQVSDVSVTDLGRGSATLTNMRLLFARSGNAGGAVSGELARVTSRRWESAGILSKQRRLVLGVEGEANDVTLAMPSSGREDLETRLASALERRAWRQPVGDRGGSVGGGFAASRAGVSGLIRRQEAQQRASCKLATEAFADLSTLMANAREVIAAAERLQAAANPAKPPPPLPGEAAAPAAGVAGDEMARDAAALENLRSALGIASPVTRESAGSEFHQQLARQLADFLGTRGANDAPSPLEAAGGMLTLADVYAIFNRARGLEVSCSGGRGAAARG